jgi:hypothetical protein
MTYPWLSSPAGKPGFRANRNTTCVKDMRASIAWAMLQLSAPALSDSDQAPDLLIATNSAVSRKIRLVQ